MSGAQGLSDFLADTKEEGSADAFSLQNSKLLKVNMDVSGSVIALAGSMIAYQGQMKFTRLGSGGVQKFLKKAVSGEQFTLMEASGSGSLFLANESRDIVLLYMNNESLGIESRNLLAFSPSISWDITSIRGVGGMMAGGLFCVELSGTGFLALTTKGKPMTMRITPEVPTYTDPNATVAWSGNLSPGVHTDADLKSLKGMFGSTHGELFQLVFQGDGFVVVQPSEEGAPSGAGQTGGKGGGLAGILGT